MSPVHEGSFMTKTVIVVEDDADLREYLRGLLNENGFVVRTASDGVAALKLIQKTEPDLAVVDLGLPTITGDTVVMEIKKNYPEIPVIILTAHDATSDVVRGLNLGADDYMTKPFSGDELLARIKARLRKNQMDEGKLTTGDLILNTKTLEVKRAGREIHLTPQELKLLEYLMINKGRVLTREMILNRLWRTNPDIETRVVDVYVGYLRKKIDNKSKKKLIQSVRGFGYKLSE